MWGWAADHFIPPAHAGRCLPRTENDPGVRGITRHSPLATTAPESVTSLHREVLSLWHESSASHGSTRSHTQSSTAKDNASSYVHDASTISDHPPPLAQQNTSCLRQSSSALLTAPESSTSGVAPEDTNIGLPQIWLSEPMRSSSHLGTADRKLSVASRLSTASGPSIPARSVSVQERLLPNSVRPRSVRIARSFWII